MFAISPRLSNDYNPLQLADELSRPLFDPRELNLLRNFPLAAFNWNDSEVQNTDKEFCVRLNLIHYRPEEIRIKSDDKRITVTAKHEEKEDKHGYVSRQMTRVYTLPEDVDPKSVTSKMNSQGILSITATKKALEAPKEFTIPVEFKG